jgi:nickel transport protein
MKKCLVFISALIMFSASALYAHDTWVAKEGDAFVVMWGHMGETEPYKPEYLKEATADSATGAELPVTVRSQDSKAFLYPAQAPAMIAIIYSAGVWVKTPEGYKNVSKREAKDVISSARGMTYNKNFWQWHDRFGKPLGSKMEIVPLKNPLTLKVGDTLPFQVLYDGKPLAGATVWGEGHDQKKELKTDQDGRGEVGIEKSGFQVVAANRKTPTPNDPDADVFSETANITFEVK